MRIIFMGTPLFAVESLKVLVDNKLNVVAVITAPDRQAGRGLKISQSPVKEFAIENNIPVLQPTNLKDPGFIEELKSWNADLQIVVAFRMLPEVVWSLPKKGTFNLHASLLPDYRGAAPINWVIINGENKTGATTFFIEKEIDTGKIIDQVETPINENETCGKLHDRLKLLGAELVLKTTKAIESGTVKSEIQNDNLAVHTAPKLNKENTKVNWNNSAIAIKNLIRGLNPFPVAWTIFGDKVLKIYSVEIVGKNDINLSIEKIKIGEEWYLTDYSTVLLKQVNDDFISLKEIQLEGKKKMSINDFLRGYRF